MIGQIIIQIGTFSFGTLPIRQVRMYDIVPPFAVGSLLSAFHYLLSSSNPSSSVLVFLLLSFPPFFSLITILNNESPLSMCLVRFLCLFPIVCVCQGSLLSNHCQHFFICYMFHPTNPLHSSPCPHFVSLQFFYILISHGPCL